VALITEICGHADVQRTFPIISPTASTPGKGHPIGATGLYAQAQDVAKLGWLYLSGGVYEGKRLLSEEWVQMVVRNGYEFHDYGHGWLCKGGMYGQIVAFHPALRAAVAWHGINHTNITPAMLEVLNRHLEKRNEHD